jgi:hypothetical protein
MDKNELEARIHKCLKGKKLMVWCGQVMIMEEGERLGTSQQLRGFLELHNRDNPSEAIQYKEMISYEKLVESYFVKPEEQENYL